MSDSPSLALPYLAAAQAQKHVTVNEALSLLDGLVHLTVITRAAATPPAMPANGDRYLIAASPTAEWLGHAGHIALRMDGAWRFLVAKEGWRLWVSDEDTLLTFNGTSWITASVPSQLQNIALLGVNATADAANKFTVASSAALFNNAGNGVQIKLNKNAASDTASFLFQTAFSGRAEFGTTGDDSFHLKVSNDGASFQEALVVSNTSAVVTAKKPLLFEAQAADPASPANGQLWYNSTSGKFRAQQNNTTIDVIGGGSSAAWGTITGALSAQTDLQTALNAKAATIHTHTLPNITDVTITSANLNTLDDGVDSTLHFHATDRNRANHTGTQAVATITGLGTLATASSVNLSTQATGTLQAAQEPAHTGDVTNTAGSLALTISNGAVTYAKMQNVSTSQRLHGRNTAGAGVTEEVTASQVLDWLSSIQGTILYRDIAGWTALAPGASGQFLKTNGAGANPAWAASAGGQTSLLFQDEGTALGATGTVDTFNVTGDNVTASRAANTVTVDVKAYKRNARWAAVGNATTVTTQDSTTFNIGGTAIAANVATTDAYTEKVRVDYLQAVAATTAIATARTAAALWYRGAIAGRGGFRARARIGNATGAANATHRGFFGLQGGIATLTDVNPSTLLNMLGLGWDAGDVNLSMMSNAGSGTATKSTLGTSFPRPTVDRTAMWDLEISCAANDTLVSYKVTNLINGAVASGSLTTNLPVNTTLLAWHMYASAGGTSSVAGFTFSYLDIASDY
jgi:hypothetical protein